MGLDGFAIFVIACERYILITNWQIHRKFLNVRRFVYVSVGFVVLSFLINTGARLTGDVLPMFGCCYWALDTNKQLDYILSMPISTVTMMSIIYFNLYIVHFVWKKN